jgi:hypothetical protein
VPPVLSRGLLPAALFIMLQGVPAGGFGARRGVFGVNVFRMRAFALGRICDSYEWQFSQDIHVIVDGQHHKRSRGRHSVDSRW